MSIVARLPPVNDGRDKLSSNIHREAEKGGKKLQNIFFYKMFVQKKKATNIVEAKKNRERLKLQQNSCLHVAL